jgi:hypothetical protein
MEKLILLTSYEKDVDFVFWDGQKIPLDVVTGIRLNGKGEIAFLEIDTGMYSKYLADEESKK